MSDLKYKTPDELRGLIKWCEAAKKKHDEDRKSKLEQIERLHAEVSEHGKSIHNIGQKEAWARIHLARKA